MAAFAWSLFATPIGTCGIVWRDGILEGVELPQGDEGAARRNLRRRYPEAGEQAPPPEVRHAIDGIIRLLSGEAVDFSDIPLNLDAVSSFERRVYEVTCTIPPGETLAYGEVARRIGEPGAARAVGQALGRNPFPIIIPCHRVLGADGRVGGFSARGGVTTKLRILTIEKARTSELPALFDDLPLAARPRR